MTEDPASVVQAANLNEVCDPHTGDCVSVAVAIENVFGGTFVCAYESPGDVRPVHATVDVDGVLIDAGGSTHNDVLYELATSGLRPDEICDDPDAHVGPVKTLESNPLYDDDIRRRAEEAIRSELE